MDAGYNYKESQEIPVVNNATARFGHAVICGTKDRIDGYVDDFLPQDFRAVGSGRRDGDAVLPIV